MAQMGWQGLESVLNALCRVGIVWLYHRQTPSSFPSSPPHGVFPLFVLLFCYIDFQMSLMCPLLLTSLRTPGIAFQLGAAVAFSNRDFQSAFILSLNCLTAAFIWYIYQNHLSVTKCCFNVSFHRSYGTLIHYHPVSVKRQWQSD